MFEKIKVFFKNFLLMNLVFGIGMCVGSIIGTTVALGMYGLPDLPADCPEIETHEVENGN
jgi:hypothetical protein